VRRQGEQHYKLLFILLYSNLSCMERDYTKFNISSIRGLARVMGTDSKRVNVYLKRLELGGLVEKLEWADNHRSVSGKVQLPKHGRHRK
jgi:DNA-binding MarR family transcriptional regulator